jgi:WhiB family redox-sensing transcriptional regulator
MPASTADRRPLTWYRDDYFGASDITPRRPRRRLTAAKSWSATAGSDPFAWMDSAACRDADPELFFPKAGGKTAKAMRICDTCPVQVQCRGFAMQTQANYDDDHGVFGRTTPRQRLAIRPPGKRSGRRGAAASQRSPAPAKPAPTKPAQGSRFYNDRAAAAEAWNLAKQVGGINEAARRLGVGTATLYRAWRRWELGIPDTSRSPARWERQLHAGGDRQRTFRAQERQRRQANGQARQVPELRVTAISQVA